MAQAQARVHWPPSKKDFWTLKRVVRHYTHFVLRQARGNKVAAAKILDVNLSTLYRWLAK